MIPTVPIFALSMDLDYPANFNADASKITSLMVTFQVNLLGKDEDLDDDYFIPTQLHETKPIDTANVSAPQNLSSEETLKNDCIANCTHKCTHESNLTVNGVIECLNSCNCDVVAEQLVKSILISFYRFTPRKNNWQAKVGIILRCILYYNHHRNWGHQRLQTV